jgi:hypothetical protein
MFDLVQQPQWPLRRPDRSGFISIVAFSLTMSIGVIAMPHSIPDGLSHHLNSDPKFDGHEKKDKKVQIPQVEIKKWQIVTNAQALKRVKKCRCHIDTQATEESVNHHSSQFAMCKLVTDDDRKWHEGFFAGVRVQIRWHCAEQ